MSDANTGITPVDNLPEGAPEMAHLWNRVAGGGQIERMQFAVPTGDETCANRLAIIAGGGDINHRETAQEYARNTAVTRVKDEYRVTINGDVVRSASATLGLPAGGNAGSHRLDVSDAR